MSDNAASQTGWVDVVEARRLELIPRVFATVYQVYQWSESRDSGQIIGTYWTRPEAITFAQQWAEDHHHKLTTADIVPLRREFAHV